MKPFSEVIRSFFPACRPFWNFHVLLKFSIRRICEILRKYSFGEILRLTVPFLYCHTAVSAVHARLLSCGYLDESFANRIIHIPYTSLNRATHCTVTILRKRCAPGTSGRIICRMTSILFHRVSICSICNWSSPPTKSTTHF